MIASLLEVRVTLSETIDLGRRVRESRLSLGLSQAEVAEMCGLSVPYVSRIEQGKGNPTIAALSALANALSVPVVELVAEVAVSEEAFASRAGPVPALEDGGRGRDESSGGGRRASHVPQRLRVGREDLLEWARSEGAGLKLAELVRRLIRETAPDGTRIYFPSGTGALSGGWDGFVNCDGVHPFVPMGSSGWELSTDQNAQRKAINDYNKRVNELPADKRGEMAYVAVICGPWIKAREFEEQRSAESGFREIRAFNADHLVVWLSEAPESTMWLREEMGQPVSGIQTLQRWWEQWLNSTDKPLGDGVVLAGRRESAEELLRVCARGGTVTVGGDIQQVEMLAFIAAAFAEIESGAGEFGDALYVDDRDTARRLLTSPVGHAGSGAAITVVVESRELADGLSPTLPQCVVIPVPGSDDADVMVGEFDIAEANEALSAEGFDHDTAWELARLGRRSLVALRRHLARRPELFRPSWADEKDPVLRRCLLLRSWDGSHPGDRAVVERFCDSPYQAIEEKLEKLSGDNEPPLVRVGTRWHVVSQAGALQAIGGRFQKTEFDDLNGLAVEILGEPDPLAGLHGVELLQGQVQGAKPAHSEHLKKGLAGSLAVLAENGDRLPAGPAGIAAGPVARLLATANSNPDPVRWQSLGPYLSALAEAAPTQFLNGMRNALAEDDSPMERALAESEDDGFGFPFGRFRSQVTAALDVLAWSPDYLPASADLLAALSEREETADPDGHAAKALKDIMCPWMPNTTAELDVRLSVLEILHDRRPSAAWRTAISMLPSPGSSKSDGHPPRFRNWKTGRKPVTKGEHYEAVARVSALMIAWASSEPHRYADLVKVSGRLLPHSRNDLLGALQRTAENADEPARNAIWTALRDMGARHRRFSDAHWALPPAELDDFEALMPLFRPASAADLHQWVFQSDAWMLADDLPPTESDFQTRHAALQKLQTEAVAAIHSEGGTTAVLEFAAAVPSPRDVGIALARVLPPDCDARMRTELDRGKPHTAEAASAYFSARHGEEGWAPIDAQITASSSPDVVAELLRASRDLQGAWERLEEMDAEVRTRYWAGLNDRDLLYCEELAMETARRLGLAGRAGAGVNLLARYCYSLADDPEYALASAGLLRMLAKQNSGETVELDHDSLTSMLEAINRQIDTVGQEEVAEIEWLHLQRLGWGVETPCLHKLMAQNPEFFAEVVKIAHRDETEDPTAGDGSEDGGSQRALAAYGLLREWPVPPGLDEAGRINSGVLRDWVDQARERLAETGRTEMGDVAIGAALAAAPSEEDGVPSPAVCDLIEDIASEALEAGFSTAVFNSLGVISIPKGGGRQKYTALEQRYRALSRELSPKWHRASSIYAQIADSYRHIANDSDTADEDWKAGIA